jgi:fatty-acyl-CoA synthase
MTLRDVLRKGRVITGAVRQSGLLSTLRPGRVATYVWKSLGKPSNPTSILRLHALNSPDKEALVDGAVRLTYAKLDERVNRLATGLVAMGVRPGDRVALMLRNCHEYLEAQWAIMRLGAVAVQIGYRLKAPEVAYILSNSEPKVLFYQPVDDETVRAAVAEAAPARLELVAAGEPYEELLGRGDPVALPTPPREAAGVMIYTSGTTGRPKGAARGFKEAFHESVADFISKVGIRHDERHLCVCPLYHSAAPAFCAFIFGMGGTIVLLPHFEAEQVLAAIVAERITSSFMVPTMLGHLAAVERTADTRCLRWLASGAAPLPTETARRVEERFGPLLFNFYGATETGLVTLACPREHTARPGTIGRLLSGNEIRLLDDAGREVAPGAVGELYVKNSMLVAGYHRNPEATRTAMNDGFFSVGDMARVDADGYYYLADRKIDMVISGGVNIYPLEVEQRIHAHPAVQECAVIGVPDPEWGESLKAFVVARPGAEVSADEVRAFCKQTLANFKCPKEVVFLEALPRNPTGKVLKRELRDF